MNHFRKRLLVELGIVVAVVGGLLTGIIFFGSNISKYSAEIIGLKAEISAKSSAIEHLAVLSQDYNSKVKNYTEILYSMVPLKDRLIGLSKEFQALTTQAKLDYTFNLKGESAGDQSSIGSVTFSLATFGNLPDLLKFISSIDKFRYLTQIDNISINRREGKNQMGMNGRIFYR